MIRFLRYLFLFVLIGKLINAVFGGARRVAPRAPSYRGCDQIKEFDPVFAAFIVAVIDGNTVQVCDDRNEDWLLSLRYIIAPGGNEPGGRDAVRVLDSLIMRGRVTVKTFQPWIRDASGRVEAEIIVASGNVNMGMVADGYAYAASGAPSMYRKLEQDARLAKDGLWASIFVK